jgi:dTDP-4-amino-4,6-dideoxygalactose transaminase
MLRGCFGAGEVLLTDSGTAALTLAVRAAAAAGGGPVALPAYCCFDVATAAVGAAAPVLLYDLDPATLGPDPGSLRRVLEQGARTIVVAHLYGLPIDYRGVEELAAGFGVLVIEDAAQGAGGALGGRPLGGLGRLAVLSFGRGKGVTGGRGGALLLHGTPVVDVARLRAELLPGWTAPSEPIAALAQWLLARPALYALPASLPFLGLGETIYRPPRPIRAMSAFSLGVLARTLTLAGTENLRRRTNATRLLALVQSVPGLAAVQAPPDAEPGFLRLPVLVAESARDRFRSAEARRLGIMPGYPRTLETLPRLEAHVLNRDAVRPGATHLLDALFTIPTHGQLAEGDLLALEGWIGGSKR